MTMSGPGVTPYGGHAGPVLAVAYACDGATLATGGRDGIIQVWDALTGEQLHQLTGHIGAVHSIAYSPDNTCLTSAGSDGTVRVWDARTGQQQHQLTPQTDPVLSVAYSPDGSSLATAGDDGKFRIWDVHSGQQQLTSRRSDAVRSVAYAPDGATLATASRDGTVTIWDAHAGEARQWLPGHTGKVLSLAYAPGGAMLATADSSGTVRIWDSGTSEQQHRLTGHTGGVWSVAYAPDGSGLASAGYDGTVRIWDPTTGLQKHVLTGHASDVWSVAYAPDGSGLASAGHDGTVRIWDPTIGLQKQVLTGHTGKVRAVAYAPDGRTLASGGEEDGTVRIWETRTGRQQSLLTGHVGSVRSLTHAPDGPALASAGEDGTVRIWDTRSSKLQRLITHGSGVWSVAYAPDGSALASGDDNGTVWVWDTLTGEQKHRFTGHIGPVHSIAYSPDGTTLVTAGNDGTVRTWDSRAGEQRRKLTGHAVAVRSVIYSPDGTTLASGDDNGIIWIWDARSGDRQHQLTDHTAPVHSIAYSPDGTSLATAGRDGTVQIQDARSGQEHHQLTGHTAPVHSISYSPDGTTLATVGDMTIRIWNPFNGTQIDGTGFGAARRTGRPPAGVRNDAPSADDDIAATLDAETLAELIAAVATSPPLAIALIGDWGVGKSSVMLQTKQHVDKLAKMSRHNPGRSLFVANVRQVWFNAWHYCDDQLWSGLVEHLFRTLATDPDIPHDPGTTPAERAEIHSRLSRLESEKEQLSEALQAADDTRQPTGWLVRMGSPAYISRIAAATFRSLVRDVRKAPWVLAAWAALGGAAYVAWSLWGSRMGAAATAVAVVVAPAVAIGQRLWSWHGDGIGITDRLRRGLNQRQRAINQEMADLKERLALVDASARLSGFLTDRASPHAYQEFRGLVGQVRNDLERLSSDLAGARQEWEASQGSAAAPLERIILYIDDLDRCPPDRVVEVLEAIHLMLTLDLFVVVVAVDARWLIKSLEYHYQDMFGASKGLTMTGPASAPESDDDSGPASPVDYLDKIFQIPYVLGRPPTEAMGRFLRILLKTETPSSANFARGRKAGSAKGAARPKGDPAENGAAQAANAGKVAGQPPRVEPPDSGRGRALGDDQDRHPHARRTEEPDTGLPDLRPLGLQLSQAEVEFMARLGAVMPTPRAAKKLANLYRMVRIGIPESGLTDFIGSEAGGPYQAVQILLAVLVGSPATAQRIFHEIRSAADGSDIFTVFAEASEFTHGDFCGRMHTELGRIAGNTPLLAGIEEYRRWCPALARYSFHTRAMTGEPPSPSDTS